MTLTIQVDLNLLEEYSAACHYSLALQLLEVCYCGTWVARLNGMAHQNEVQ
jgi:hypothetical protein